MSDRDTTLLAALRGVLESDVGRQTLLKLAGGQGVNTAEGQAWLTASSALSARSDPASGGTLIVAGAQARFAGQAWTECSVEHHQMVQGAPSEWAGYETRLIYAYAPG